MIALGEIRDAMLSLLRYSGGWSANDEHKFLSATHQHAFIMSPFNVAAVAMFEIGMQTLGANFCQLSTSHGTDGSLHIMHSIVIVARSEWKRPMHLEQ